MTRGCNRCTILFLYFTCLNLPCTWQCLVHNKQILFTVWMPEQCKFSCMRKIGKLPDILDKWKLPIHHSWLSDCFVPFFNPKSLLSRSSTACSHKVWDDVDEAHCTPDNLWMEDQLTNTSYISFSLLFFVFFGFPIFSVVVFYEDHCTPDTLWMENGLTNTIEIRKRMSDAVEQYFPTLYFHTLTFNFSHFHFQTFMFTLSLSYHRDQKKDERCGRAIFLHFLFSHQLLLWP